MTHFPKEPTPSDNRVIPPLPSPSKRDNFLGKVTSFFKGQRPEDDKVQRLAQLQKLAESTSTTISTLTLNAKRELDPSSKNLLKLIEKEKDDINASHGDSNSTESHILRKIAQAAFLAAKAEVDKDPNASKKAIIDAAEQAATETAFVCVRDLPGSAVDREALAKMISNGIVRNLGEYKYSSAITQDTISAIANKILDPRP